MSITKELRSQERVMEHATHVRTGKAGLALERTRSARVGNPSLQAFWVLRIVFTIAPVVAGLDKFFHWLVDWDKYVAPAADDLIGGRAHALMLAVGVVEIVAGIGVAIRPRFFAYVVSAWLLGIVVNLLMIPGYYDIALRDLGLAVGALALGRLSEVHARGQSARRSDALSSTDTRVTS
jgi:uncharacterized membrane protein YphA (DoxX/SURF4 family)